MKFSIKNAKKGYVFIWPILYLLSLVPILLLEKYNFPSADDFGFGTYARIAWTDTHNIFCVLAAACKKVAEVWQTWQGTYSSVFLMALQPGIFGDNFYWITTWIMVGALSISVIWLFKVIFVDCLGSQKEWALAAASIYLLVAVQCMIDKTQGFFWYNGAVHYMLPQAMLFILSALVLKMMIKSENVKRYVIIGMLLIIYIGGGNLITGLECGIWLFTTGAVFVIFKKKVLVKRISLFLITWIIAFGINVIAPGNSVRQASFADHPSVISAVLQSFFYGLDFVFGRWQSWTILACAMLILPFVIRTIQSYKGGFSFPLPGLVMFYSYCILASMFTPSVYANGEPGAGRIYNIIYLTYLLLLVVNMLYFYGWYWKKYGGFKVLEEKAFGLWLSAGLLGFGFCFCIEAGVNSDTFTSTSALKSIVSGEAKEYRQQQQQRLQILLNEDIMDAELPTFTVKPELLFYEDISSDASGWINVRMAAYYEKGSVKLEE